MRKAHALTLIGIGVAAAVVLTALPLLASDQKDDALTLHPVADTTATQVQQDGDNSVKTTLASCPQLCDNNPNGRRDAVLEFDVQKIPAGSIDVRARLRVYSWHALSATVTARAADGGAREAGFGAAPALGVTLQSRDTVVQGYNDFDVSTVVKGNGSVTFVLQQQTLNTRIYWASRENSKSSVRPELVLTYRSGAHPPGQASQPGSPFPSAGPASPGASASPTGTASASPAGGTKPTPGRPTTTAAPAGWHQVWADEFNGSTVDTKKWNLRNEGRSIDLGCNTTSAQNTFEGNGVLTLRALRQNATCAGQNRGYTEGYLDTIGTASWTYGRFEMRAKSPNAPDVSRGLWPAFWLRPDDGGHGEIDVVELPGGNQYYKAATQAIFYDYTPVKQDQRWTFPTGHPADGFHTYTTEWEPGVLRWYIDDKLVYTRDRSTTPWFDEAFSKPFNLRLNFQVGGWLGNPDATTVFPADFQVDYVRVWQR